MSLSAPRRRKVALAIGPRAVGTPWDTSPPSDSFHILPLTPRSEDDPTHLLPGQQVVRRTSSRSSVASDVPRSKTASSSLLLGPYQASAVRRIVAACHTLWGNLVVAMMGSGKTITVLTLLANMPAWIRVAGVLRRLKRTVLVPAAIASTYARDSGDARLVWPDDAERAAAFAAVRVVTYEQLAEWLAGDNAAALDEVLDEAFVAADEAHYLLRFLYSRAGATEAVKARFRAAIVRCYRVVLLTGTPIVTEFGEFAALLNIVRRFEPPPLPITDDALRQDPRYRVVTAAHWARGYQPAILMRGAQWALGIVSWATSMALATYRDPTVGDAGSEADVRGLAHRLVRVLSAGYGDVDAWSHADPETTWGVLRGLAVQFATWLATKATDAHISVLHAAYAVRSDPGTVGALYVVPVALALVLGAWSLHASMAATRANEVGINAARVASDYGHLVSFFDYNVYTKPVYDAKLGRAVPVTAYFPIKRVVSERVPLDNAQALLLLQMASGTLDATARRLLGVPDDADQRSTATFQAWGTALGAVSADMLTHTAVWHGRDPGNIGIVYDDKGATLWSQVFAPAPLDAREESGSARGGRRTSVDTKPRFACAKFTRALEILRSLRAARAGATGGRAALPVVYANHVRTWSHFSAFLTSVGEAHLVYTDVDTPARRAALVPAAMTATYGAEASAPLCVVLHPAIREGLSFTASPAMVVLEPVDGYGIQEQVYARVLRRYPDALDDAARAATRTKTIHQLSSVYGMYGYQARFAAWQLWWQKFAHVAPEYVDGTLHVIPNATPDDMVLLRNATTARAFADMSAALAPLDDDAMAARCDVASAAAAPSPTGRRLGVAPPAAAAPSPTGRRLGVAPPAAGRCTVWAPEMDARGHLHGGAPGAVEAVTSMATACATRIPEVSGAASDEEGAVGLRGGGRRAFSPGNRPRQRRRLASPSRP